jgi:hypothetical protein
MFSSSVLTSPELPPSPSFNVSEPRWIEDVALPLPLLRLSSSSLLVPPEENLLRLWPKLLLYRAIGAGFGELEVDEAMAVSFGSDGCLKAVCGRALSDVRLRGWVSELGVAVRPSELLGLPSEPLGEAGIVGPGAGDDDNDPALKG